MKPLFGQVGLHVRPRVWALVYLCLEHRECSPRDSGECAGQPHTGADSGHFIVDRANVSPKAGVPQVGGSMHFGETNPFVSPLRHLEEQ